MHYTLFELERIEKVLQAKLYAAREAYSDRELKVREAFAAKVNGNPEFTQGGKPWNEKLAEYWERAKQEDMDLMLLWGEVDLFERGINSLYSYWNYAVEIFIDNMRTKISEKEGA